MHAFMYTPGKSLVHRLSPAAKIIALICLFIIVLSIQNLIVIIAGLICVVAVIFLAGIGVLISRITSVLIILFAFPLLLWSFYFPGVTIVLTFWSHPLYLEGFKYGALMGLKFDVMILCGLLLLGTTRIEEFSAGLCYLGAPYRVSFSLSLAFRLVPLFFNTFDIIRQAQNSRGLAVGRGNLIRRMRDTIPLLIPVFVSALRQSDQLAIALESKGFGFSRNRSSIEPVRMSWLDLAVAAGSILMAGFSFALFLMNKN